MGWLNNLLGFLKVHEDETTGIHGVGASTIDSASARDSAIATHEADTSTHGVTQIDGVTERNSAMATHEADKTSVHAFDSDGLLTAMPGVNKSQIILDSGTANRKGSIFLHNTDEFYLATNCYHNGTSWMRFDTTVIAEILAMEPNIGIRVYRASAGANPIGSWDLANGIVLSGTDGKVPDASLESPVGTHAAVTTSIHGFDASGNAPSQAHTGAKHSVYSALSGNVAASRAIGTQYQNSTSWRFLYAQIRVGTTGLVTGYIGSASANTSVAGANLSGTYVTASIVMWIPPSWYYKINADSGSFTIDTWYESDA